MSLRPSTKTEIRRIRYKVSVDAEEGRRRREDFLVEIRKSKRNENLMKKRRVKVLPPDYKLISNDPFESLLEIANMITGVFSDDPSLQLEYTTRFRVVLSFDRSPPTDNVIKSGVVPRFVEFLKKDDNPKLQFEAAWALTNIASGASEHTKVVIDHGVVPLFVQLLASPDDDVREQAIWGLGNVAGDSIQCRDFVLNSGAFIPLLHQLNNHATLSILRNATWTLSNFFRGKPSPPFDLVKPALELHLNSRDEEVLRCVCLAISYLCDGSIDGIQSVIEAGFVPKLVEVLRQSPSHFLDDFKDHYRVYRTTSVIDANLIPRFVYLAQNNELDLKKEGVWAISNVTAGGSHDQIIYLVQQGCIKPLCDLLVCPDVRIILVCLDGLEHILNVGEANIGEVNDYYQLVEDAQGLEKIQNLRQHGSYKIYAKALKILETFWHDE
ncbi:unnamed protein product [Arabidopsis thaliana]|uniref:IBB domain-containing protein n=1 Tax=Arabidopsis thaliana TaxID=3702 RepID=A0A5S9YCQ5_ARATH|nr:unnamed protein product [Arabidopsis thaliana]